MQTKLCFLLNSRHLVLFTWWLSYVCLSLDDPLNTEILNGNAVPSGVTEKVKVDIETPELVPEEKPDLAAVAEDPEGTVFCLVSQNKDAESSTRVEPYY